MLILLSPAKTLDFDSTVSITESTTPAFLKRSAQLVEAARTLSEDELAKLMSISPDLASLNHQRFASWKPAHTGKQVRQALLAFKGDVYQGLEAESLDIDDIAFAQQHLRILSGLYGVLRPLDMIRPYRLEMGSRLANPAGANLYAFWGDTIAKALAADLPAGEPVINLASQEYFKAVDTQALGAKVITPQFKEWRQGQLKIVSFSAKRARGMMARYAITERINQAAKLKKFKLDGYRYEPELSGDNEWVFAREQP